MVKFILFLLYCIPAYGIAFGTGYVVMDITNNVFKATAANTISFAVLMLLFYIVSRKR